MPCRFLCTVPPWLAGWLRYIHRVHTGTVCTGHLSMHAADGHPHTLQSCAYMGSMLPIGLQYRSKCILAPAGGLTTVRGRGWRGSAG
ncbi:hypothetical protein BZA05DRAFT_388426 [Tricharina praecox]|uniref:uncharacterized protein n=1 Tax=Tricharina praecox TaxID=43433 RepID=UPI0022203AD7|nr:uncharacterized protein BZA05DRAFT_388426 [Tricharina praecox]KAI5856416.1 hypothetical protein BZA05DRAFT_388426 [Tricharina praecox]